MGEWAVDSIHMFVWFVILQLILALFSGAITVDFEKFKGKDKREELEEELEGREINMKCYAALMAHLTGFASINAWGSFQQLPFFRQSAVLTFIAVFVAFLGQCVLQRITAKIREMVCLGDDGEEDPFEEMWVEETEEAENDVMALTLSFMTVNAWRFVILGCLPNVEGKEEPPACPENGLYEHSHWQMALLFLSALFISGLVFAAHYSFPTTLEEWHLPISPKLALRLVWVAIASVAMCFSWCMFYALQMILASVSAFQGEEELLSVVLALVCSLGVFSMMIPLDLLADADWTDERVDEGIRATMETFAILVGFAWEQCFDTSVDALAEATAGWRYIGPHSAKLILSIFCAGLLVPAWKWYMLPYILKKGWRFGPVGAPHDLEDMFKQFIEEENEKFASIEDPEERARQQAEDGGRTLDVISRLHRAVTADGTKGYIPPTDPSLCQQLVISADPDGMRRQIIELSAALAKAERERDNAQNMVAYQMEAMLENMKKLNLTVTRIP
jgi:hypothetical protein